MQKLYIKKSLRFVSVLVLGLLLSSGVYAAKIKVLDNPTLIKAAEALPQQGVLRQDANGYVYLVVSPDYISKLFPLLSMPQVSKNDALSGAHISIFYPKEAQRRKIGALPEVGKTFNFKITGLSRIDVKRCVNEDDGNRTWYVLTVESPELTALRERFGYSAKRFHPHISIGYEQQVFKGQACPFRDHQRYQHNRREQQPAYLGQ
ncbi:hypothetical protein BH10PSE19_BH10PSE19_20820 [soil metagenome]